MLCLVRIRPSSPDRHAWRLVAAALAFCALANTYWCWFIQPIVPEPFPTLTDVLWLAYYPCAFLAVLLLVRSRDPSLPADRRVGRTPVGLGTASVAAALVLPATLSDLGYSVAAIATTLSYPILDVVLLAAILAACAVFRWHPPPGLWWLGLGSARCSRSSTPFI